MAIEETSSQDRCSGKGMIRKTLVQFGTYPDSPGRHIGSHILGSITLRADRNDGRPVSLWEGCSEAMDPRTP